MRTDGGVWYYDDFGIAVAVPTIVERLFAGVDRFGERVNCVDVI